MTVSKPTTTAARAPRKPQDRQASKAEQLAAAAKPPVGHDTLRPVSDLRSGELATAQADIIDIFGEIGIDLTEENRGKDVEIETTPAVLRGFGKLGAYLEQYAADVPAFIEIDKGRGAQNRIAELAMWYLGQMGEADGSAS